MFILISFSTRGKKNNKGVKQRQFLWKAIFKSWASNQFNVEHTVLAVTLIQHSKAGWCDLASSERNILSDCLFSAFMILRFTSANGTRSGSTPSHSYLESVTRTRSEKKQFGWTFQSLTFLRRAEQICSPHRMRAATPRLTKSIVISFPHLRRKPRFRAYGSLQAVRSKRGFSVPNMPPCGIPTRACKREYSDQAFQLDTTDISNDTFEVTSIADYWVNASTLLTGKTVLVPVADD